MEAYQQNTQAELKEKKQRFAKIFSLILYIPPKYLTTSTWKMTIIRQISPTREDTDRIALGSYRFS